MTAALFGWAACLLIWPRCDGQAPWLAAASLACLGVNVLLHERLITRAGGRIVRVGLAGFLIGVAVALALWLIRGLVVTLLASRSVSR